MTIIGGLDDVAGLPAGAFAILTRLHHAVADGTTARGILTALHHAEGEEPPPLRRAARRPRPSTIEMAARALTHNARQIAGAAPRLIGLLPGAGPALAGVASRSPKKALGRNRAGDLQIAGGSTVPATVFNGDMEYRRVFQLTSYPLADIKRIRSLAEGSTLNDAVLALVGGGIRRYLAATGEEAGLDLYALCPINLREDKLTTESRLGNNISLMQINLGTRGVGPAARMARVVEATRRAKLQQKASTAKEIIALSRDAPNVLLASATRLAAAAAFRSGSAVRLSNCVITNVPGPQEPLYFMGARLVTFTGIGPVSSGSGPTFAVTSYLGRLTVAFTACPGWISDPQLMVRCLDESHAELLAAASPPARRPRAPGRRPLRTPSVAKRAARSAGRRVVEQRRARR
jgi:WS/DGAT/MGAT family acyltransferase